MTFFGLFGSAPLAFTNPMLLTALLGLPALWLLLRITPPAPKTIIFPPYRFLEGLTPDRPTSARTPWWLLLLRLTIAALLIIGLSGPLLSPPQSLTGSGPINLIMDNGWSAASSWDSRLQTALDITARAARQNRTLYITATAPQPGTNKPFHAGPLSASEAVATLKGLKPYSWPDTLPAVDKLVDHIKDKNVTTYYLSDGLQKTDLQDTLDIVQKQGDVRFYKPDSQAAPLLLRSAEQPASGFDVTVEKPSGLHSDIPVTIQLRGKNSALIDSQNVTMPANQSRTLVHFDLPATARAALTQVEIAGHYSAGAMLLLDSANAKRHVGIVTAGGDKQSAPFIEASYFLQKALAPYAHLDTGTLADLLGDSESGKQASDKQAADKQISQEKDNVLILPDIAAMPDSELKKLDNWVAQGGVLIRFAGPNMAQAMGRSPAASLLLPVPLRAGGRALDGALTWDKPLTLAPFPDSSPLHGIALSPETTISQQLLAQPVENIGKISWASLSDGTPLITAKRYKDGLLIFVHTTADTRWTNLPLSGTYVQILRRIVNLSPAQAQQTTQTSAALSPILYIDGFGNIQSPQNFIKPLAALQKTAKIDASHPPGLYGQNGITRILNIGDDVEKMNFINTLPHNMQIQTYNNKVQEKPLAPYILAAAFLLFVLDWAVMLFMQRSALHPGKKLRMRPLTAAMLIALSLSFFSTDAFAADTQQDISRAGKLHLAYIKSGNQVVDQTAQKGLEALSDTLATRTSVVTGSVIALNPAKDDLSFFPLIYWPISANTKTISDSALIKLQNYMDQGGTLLIDTREADPNGPNAQALRQMTTHINMPPLEKLNKDHVLGRSFYLLGHFPGRYDNAPLWVSANSDAKRDGVSPLIVGSHDWAAAWAASKNSSNSHQDELALRTGVNIVMYALTGNYKADQVHLPIILERLDQ